MKRLQTTVFLLILFSSSLMSANARLATVTINHSNQVVQAGDKINISGQNFVANDEVVAVQITLLDNEKRIISNVFSSDYDLNIDKFGTLTGSLTIDKIYQGTSSLEVLIFTKNTDVKNSNSLIARGYGFSDPPIIESTGTASISDATFGNNDGIAQNDEVLSISGSGWGTSTLLGTAQLEFTDIAGTISNGQQSFAASTADISGGILSGTLTTTSNYNSGTQSIRARVVTTIFETAESNALPVPDTNPPGLAFAYATYLDTIQLVFDEPVSEVGNALNNITFSGTVGSTLTPGDLYPIGAEPTTTWNVSLVGGGILNNRAVNDVTVAYNHNSDGDSLLDASGNEVESTSPDSVVHDSIPPADPVLTAPIDSANFEGGTVDWSATAETGSQDPSLSFLELQGSNDGSNWVNTGSQDTDTGDENYSGSFTLGTQYAYYRVRAVDDQGNESYSGSTINYQNAHHISITSSPISEPVSTFEDQVTFQIRDAYGNAENVTQTFPLSMIAGSGTGLFRLTPTGGDVTFVNLTNASSGSFYFAADQPGTKTIKIANVALFDAEQDADIVIGTASNILVVLPGQSFVDGTGVINSPTPRDAGVSFNIQLVIVDVDNFVITTENSPRDIDFSSTAGNAPDGTRPTIDGVNSDSWANHSISFTDGVSNDIPVVLYNAESSVTITAGDDSGTPTLTGVPSSGLTVNFGSLNQFAFVMASPQRDGYTVTGVNTITAQDVYQNVVTNFNAATNTVTVTRSTGPGTVTITGLGSANNNVLNQASDFVNGIAGLTAQGMAIDASITGNYTLVATSSVVPTRTGISNSFAVNRVVDVSNPNTPDRSLMDTTATASDFTLSATLSGGEDPSVSDDFRILWGFNTTGNFGRPYGLERQSPDRTPGATIDYVVPASDVQNLDGGPYDYMFWWVENLSTNPNATILEGLPTVTNPRRLILNPNLITQGGINGGDVAQGAFTPGSTNQEMVSILFGADPTIATIKVNSLTFNKSGTATGTDISAFHLYRDGGSLGQYDSGVDILLRTYTYSGGNTITFGNLTDLLNITGNANYILVTVDVNSGAVPANTLGLVLANEQNISLVNNVFNGGASAITINSFSNLGTAGDYSLPVTLVSFQAHSGYGNIQLEWTTASEENNDGFYIMRSEDPEGEFARLNEELIDGSGSVTTSHKYSFTDAEITPEVTYYYKLYSVDYNGEVYAYKTLASSAAMPLPKSFAVYQNYPNPFNPTTRLKFDVPKQAEITIEIYNMLGQKIRTLVNNEIYQPGVYDHVIWDARDDHGYQVANGIYYMVFNAKDFDFRQVRKLVFMK